MLQTGQKGLLACAQDFGRHQPSGIPAARLLSGVVCCTEFSELGKFACENNSMACHHNCTTPPLSASVFTRQHHSQFDQHTIATTTQPLTPRMRAGQFLFFSLHPLSLHTFPPLSALLCHTLTKPPLPTPHRTSTSACLNTTCAPDSPQQQHLVDVASRQWLHCHQWCQHTRPPLR